MIPINFGDPPEVDVCASECSVSTTGGWISVKIDTGIHGPPGMNCNDCGYSLTSFGSHHQKVKNSNVSSALVDDIPISLTCREDQP